MVKRGKDRTNSAGLQRRSITLAAKLQTILKSLILAILIGPVSELQKPQPKDRFGGRLVSALHYWLLTAGKRRVF